MCGIAGAVVFDGSGSLLDDSFVAALAEPMRHRGPDGDGTWLSNDRRVGLAHRRLAILDLSPAAGQPMADSAGDIHITFNGEIYNHMDLRRELEALGHRFRTDHSDTEVIIEAYRRWGIECVHRLHGMFAFGLWDARAGRLWLVRDRIGIKPLYYAVTRERIVFASEIKAILATSDQARSVDEDAFIHYLSFLTAPPPATLFSGICKLGGGMMLSVDLNGRVQEHRYWDAITAARPVTGSDDEIAEQLLAALRKSVKLRKLSDVPVGVFLSGGLDSSAIAALFSEGETQAVKTFTVGYDQDYGSYRSEFEYARMAAAHVGAEHHEIRLSARDFIDFLPRMIELQDEPIADPVCAPVHYVARLAREHGVVVAQVGEGADELFWGYPRWKRARTIQRLLNSPLALNSIKHLLLAGVRAVGKDAMQTYDALERSARGLPIFWGNAERFGDATKRSLLSRRLRERWDSASAWQIIEPIHERYRQGACEPSILNWMTYVDLSIRLPELLLMRVDKMTMGVGLEARVPFLDHELVAFALGIPEEVKTRGGVLKAILKRAVRGLIPEQIINRPKQGFGVPVHEWLQQGLPRDTMDVVSDFMARTDLFDKQAVDNLFADPRAASTRWYVLNVALWWDRFIRRAPAATAARSSIAAAPVTAVT